MKYMTMYTCIMCWLWMLAVCSAGHKLNEKLPTNELIADDR